MSHLHTEITAVPRGPVSLIGVPIQAGTHQAGCLMGPAALRTAGIAAVLGEIGCTVLDHGDVAPAPGSAESIETVPTLRRFGEVVAWTRVIGDHVHAALDAGEIPVVLGGDHSLSMGSVDGVARHCRQRNRPLFVLWLDAHADFNTPDTSPSGNMHGMPLAALCGEPGLEGVFGDHSGEPRLSPDQVHLFGIRSVDRGERALLKARGVDVVDMRFIDEWGVAVPLRRILERVAAEKGFLHVSLDVDFLDPSLAPGVGTTVPGGATYREAHLIMEMIHDSGLMRSLDVVELNPFLDERGRSALILVDLVASLFGRNVMDRATAAGPVF
jgi:arginase